MADLSTNRVARTVTLCSLYVAQGLPYGFVSIALKNYLSKQGVSLSEIGALVSMIALPWAFKFLWGPIVDRFGIPAMGRRRPWMLLAQLGAVTTIAALAFVPNLGGDLKFLGWAIFTINLFLSLQDVSTDALAVDLLNERERGRVNGFMYGCSYLGSFLGGTFVGHFLTRDGGNIRDALFILAGCVLVISLLPLLLRERAGEKLLPWSKGSVQPEVEQAAAKSMRELFAMLLKAFSKPVAILALLYGWLAYLGNTSLNVIGSNFFVTEAGWSDEGYSALESFGLWFSLGGSMLGGILADRFGTKRILITSGSILALLWIFFSQSEPLWSNRIFVGVLVFGQAAAFGAMAVSSFSLFMGLSDRRVAATQFTTYMAMLNLSIVTGNRIAGWVKEVVTDVPNAFLTFGIFHLGVMLFVAFFLHPKPLKEVSETTAETN